MVHRSLCKNAVGKQYLLLVQFSLINYVCNLVCNFRTYCIKFTEYSCDEDIIALH